MNETPESGSVSVVPTGHGASVKVMVDGVQSMSREFVDELPVKRTVTPLAAGLVELSVSNRLPYGCRNSSVKAWPVVRVTRRTLGVVAF